MRESPAGSPKLGVCAEALCFEADGRPVLHPPPASCVAFSKSHKLCESWFPIRKMGFIYPWFMGLLGDGLEPGVIATLWNAHRG